MSWNRGEGQSALERNLDGSQHGFRVTGDAAMVDGSVDFAMFSDEGNQAVAEMVAVIKAGLSGQPDEDAAYAGVQILYKAVAVTHGEIRDTMVRETIAYALDPAWNARFGLDVDQWRIN